MPILAFALSNWKWIGLALLIAAIGIQTWRLDSCQNGRKEDKVHAEQRESALRTTIDTQNQAVAALKADGDRKIKAAQNGLKAAQEGTRAARSEAERLRALAAAPRPTGEPSACPAGDAVAEIRRGLKP